jgi:hypothetical protein
MNNARKLLTVGVAILILATGFFLMVGKAQAQAGTNMSMTLNGTNQYVQVPDDDTLDMAATLTVEAWVWPDNLGSAYAIVGKGYGDGGNNTEFLFNIHGDQTLVFHGVGTGWKSSASTIPTAQQWYHVAVTLSGGTLTFYINGQFAGSQGFGAISAGTGDLYIGKQGSTAGNYFDGKIDDVRLWNVARTQAQIQEYMHRDNAPGTSLVGYWKFDNSNGADSSSASNNGTPEGSPSFSATTAPIADPAVLGAHSEIGATWSADNSNSSSIMTVTDGDISDPDRIIFGHDNGSITSPNTTDVPATIIKRVDRVWLLEVHGTGDLIGDITFDCSTLQIIERGTTNDEIKLLEDTNGTFSDATLVSGTYDPGSDTFTVTGHTFED